MIPILIYTVVYLLLFAITDLLFHKLQWRAELTRKIAHVSAGFIALTFPLYFQFIWQVVVITAGFVILLVVSEKMNWFKSITAVKRKTWGSWLFPVAILLSFSCMKLTQEPKFFFFPMLILTASDTAASLIGKRFPWKPFTIYNHQKTWSGTAAFFIATIIILQIPYAELGFFESFALWQSLSFAVAVTAVEALSYKGVDNLTIPLSCIILLYFFI